MHELVVISNIFKAIKNAASKNNLVKVSKVKLQVGKLRQLEESMLRFAFDTISKETVAQGAQLELDYIPVVMFCTVCSSSFEVKGKKYICPSCESSDLQLLKGKEVILESIEGERE